MPCPARMPGLQIDANCEAGRLQIVQQTNYPIHLTNDEFEMSHMDLIDDFWFSSNHSV